MKSSSQQTQFSMATDIDLLRSMREDQRFWAGGQTITAIFHFTPKDALYTWLSYYTNGKYENRVTATAKDPLTTPQQIDYISQSQMALKQISTGWRHYFKGSSNIQYTWSIYGYGGFGLVFGRVNNALSSAIDTSLYNAPVLGGEASFKRLTLDLGLGWERHLGSSFYLYSEARVWIPTSDYPSKYLLVNNNAPLIGILNLGIRILFVTD